MNLKELRERLARLYQEARGLADKNDKDGLSAAEEARWAELKTEITDVRGQVDAAEQRAREAAEFRNGDREFNTAGGGAPASNAEVLEGRAAGAAGGQSQALTPAQREVRTNASIGQMLAMADGYKEARTKGWRKGINTGAVEVGSFLFRNLGLEARDVAGMTPQELRTLIYTGAVPSSPAFIAPNRVPGVYTPDMPELTVRSAFLNLQTSSPVIQFFRELLFTNAAAFTAEATATSGASGAKPESALTFEADSVTAEVIAHWIPATNQMLDDEPAMRGIIEGRLLDGLRLAEDDALLNGDGVSPNIEGLLTVSGTQSADAAYFGATQVENVGAAWEDFDRITRARRLVRQVGRARPNFVMLSPADLERLVTITDLNGQYYSGSPFGDIALSRMRGLQVIETEALDEGNFVVGDGRMAAVFDRMAAAVTAGWIDQQFIRNMITILAEERLAFAVFRPAAFVIGELTSI